MNNKGVIMIAGGRGLFWKPVSFAFFSNRILTLILLHIAVSGKLRIMIASAANRTSLSNRHQTQLATHLATSSGPLREPDADLRPRGNSPTVHTNPNLFKMCLFTALISTHLHSPHWLERGGQLPFSQSSTDLPKVTHSIWQPAGI